MNRKVLSVTRWLGIVIALVSMGTEAGAASSSQEITKSLRFARCFQVGELSQSLTTLKQQGGAEVAKVYESLLEKARIAPECQTEVVQALIKAMREASDTTNQIENYFLWQNGASLIAKLKATDALDLLIANITLTDGWSASLSESHFPALVAILRIGKPSIAKLQTVLRKDSVPHRRKFAAFGIAYIGGGQARRALRNALPGETDPCVKKFLQLSLRAFDNRTNPNHISTALNGKWVSAFYCL